MCHSLNVRMSALRRVVAGVCLVILATADSSADDPSASDALINLETRAEIVAGDPSNPIVVDQQGNVLSVSTYNAAPKSLGHLPSRPVAMESAGWESGSFAVLGDGKVYRIADDGVSSDPWLQLPWDNTSQMLGGGERVGFVSGTGRLQVYDAATKALQVEIEVPPEGAVFAADEDLQVAVSATKETIKVVDLLDGRDLLSLKSYGSIPEAVAISKSLGLLAQTDSISGLSLWNLATGELKDTGQAFAMERIWHLRFVNDLLVVVTKDGVTAVCEAATLRTVRTLSTPTSSEATSVSVSNGGDLLFLLRDGNVWHGQLLRHAYGGDPPPEPQTVAVWYATNRVRNFGGTGTFWSRWLYTVARLEYLVMFGLTALGGLVCVMVVRWRRLARFFLAAGAALCLLALIAAGSRDSSTQLGTNSPYTNELDTEQLHWGRCLVSVPADRPPGEVSEPSDWFGFEGAEDPLTHFILLNEAPSTPDEIRRIECDARDGSSPPELLLFVHGFNVPFESVANRTAQLKVDLKIDGPAFFFSWPSYGRELLYTWDEDNAESSVAAFEEMLRELTTQFPESRMHVLGHSMGTRIVMQAFCRIHLQWKGAKPNIQTLAIAAPDIDRRRFAVDMAQVVQETNLPVTLYASSNDRALEASYIANRNHRLGHAEPELVITEGAETIDASDVDTSFLGHGYYGSSRQLLNDLFQLIKDQRPAAKRFGLTSSDLNGKTYWTLR